MDSKIQTHKFEKLPERIVFGDVVTCPRCRGRTKRMLFEGQGVLHRDRYADKPRPCDGCNGFGIVPNKGPLPNVPEDEL